jgi:L-lactate dehydrogenase complex protein LldF
MLLSIRARHVALGQPPAWLRLGIWAFGLGAGSPFLFSMAQTLGGWGTRLIARDGRIRGMPPPLSAWTDRRDFPVFARQTFQRWWKARPPKN